MLAFAIRRLFEAAFVMLTVALLAFVLFRFVGDPVNQMVGQDTSLEDRMRLREELGLNDPVAVQFGRFLVNTTRFDFGISYQMKQPVVAIVNSHWHLDHSGGIATLREAYPGVQVYASNAIDNALPGFLAGEKASFITGEVLCVSGGYHLHT